MVEWNADLFKAAVPIEESKEPDCRPIRQRRSPPTPWYNKGKEGQKAAFVFAAPGRHEADWQMPAAGDTGINLNLLLAFLKKARSDIFPDRERYDYTITNASKKVLYKELTDSSTPSRKDFRDDYGKFNDELNGAEFVLCMGDDAWDFCSTVYGFDGSPQIQRTEPYDLAFPGAQSSSDNKIFIRAYHLSNQGMNASRTKKTPEEVEEAKTAFLEAVSDMINGDAPKDWHNRKYRIMMIAKAIVAALEAAPTSTAP